MGALTLNKIDRLYWMGRYAERVNTTLMFLMEYYDEMIDGDPMPHEEFCERLTLPDVYKDNTEFLRNYTFDENNPDSVYVAADRMLGNGMTLRETISSETLSYLQMAMNSLEAAKTSSAPILNAQEARDAIMAFRGSFDDKVEDKGVRNIVKCGWTAERISIYLRLGYPDNLCAPEINKLLYRVTRAPVRIRSSAFAKLLAAISGGDEAPLKGDREDLIEAAEELVEI